MVCEQRPKRTAVFFSFCQGRIYPFYNYIRTRNKKQKKNQLTQFLHVSHDKTRTRIYGNRRSKRGKKTTVFTFVRRPHEHWPFSLGNTTDWLCERYYCQSLARSYTKKKRRQKINKYLKKKKIPPRFPKNILFRHVEYITYG